MLESEDTRAKSTTWLEARRPDQDSDGNGRFISIDKMEAEMRKAHATYVLMHGQTRRVAHDQTWVSKCLN